MKLHILPRRQTQRWSTAVSRRSVSVGQVVEKMPGLPGDRTATRDGDANHINPIPFAAGFGSVELQIDAIRLCYLLRFPDQVGSVMIAQFFCEIASHAVGIELVQLLAAVIGLGCF